eukprot:6166533-Pyramimonas_sp.AAC.1
MPSSLGAMPMGFGRNAHIARNGFSVGRNARRLWAQRPHRAQCPPRRARRPSNLEASLTQFTVPSSLGAMPIRSGRNSLLAGRSADRFWAQRPRRAQCYPHSST